MSANNFWNNFSLGFMHGMFGNSPFFGCGWNNMFFNNWNSTSLFLFPSFNNSFYTYPTMNMAMPSLVMPTFTAPNFNFDSIFNNPPPTKTLQNSSFIQNNNLLDIMSDSFVRQNVTTPRSEEGNSEENTVLQLETGNEKSVIEQKNEEKNNSSTPNVTSAPVDSKKVVSAPQSSPKPKPDNASKLASLKHKHWTEMSDAEMRQVYGNYTKDITTRYQGDAASLNKYLRRRGVLAGQGQAFIDAQNKYGINAAVLAAIAVQETGGKSHNAKTKNNVTNIRNKDKSWRKFSSISECINYTASLLSNNYVKNSGKSNTSLKKLYQINAKYCPVSDTSDRNNTNAQWAQRVDRIVNDIEAVV